MSSGDQPGLRLDLFREVVYVEKEEMWAQC